MSAGAANQVSWICCQAGAREHYAIPRALKRLNADMRMITDLWWRLPVPTGMRSLAALSGRFHRDLSTKEVTAFNSRTFVGRLGNRLARRDWYRGQVAANRAFQQNCLRELKAIPDDGNERVVFAYSYSAREILSYARARGWKTLLGQIDPGPRESRIVMEEYARLGMPVSCYYLPPEDYWESWRAETELADGIVVNSSWSAECLTGENVAPGKIHVIPCAYEADPGSVSFHRHYPDRFSAERPMRVLFLGQPVVRKGIHLLLEAAAGMVGEPVRFTIVGGGSDLAAPRLPPNVEWGGQIPRHQAARCYREADVFVLPTLSDGFALTQLEASAWKLPLVVSRHCGEVVVDGVNGILLGEVSADAVRGTLEDLLAKTRTLQRMSDAPDVLAGFRLEAVGRRLLDLTRPPQGPTR